MMLKSISTHVCRAGAAMQQAKPIVERATVAAAVEEHPADPYPGPSASGKIVIYGQPTSRVCKVLWMCSEVGLEYDHVLGFPFRLQPWALALNPKGALSSPSPYSFTQVHALKIIFPGAGSRRRGGPFRP
jgi:hypothetical protein